MITEQIKKAVTFRNDPEGKEMYVKKKLIDEVFILVTEIVLM